MTAESSSSLPVAAIQDRIPYRPAFVQYQTAIRLPDKGISLVSVN